MKKLVLACSAALALGGCGGGGNNAATNDAANLAAEGGADLNAAIGGDEISPIPEAEDDMIANSSGGANAAMMGNEALPVPQPQPVPIPAPAPPSR